MAEKDRPRRRVRDRRNLLISPPPKAADKAAVDKAVAELIEQLSRQDESNKS